MGNLFTLCSEKRSEEPNDKGLQTNIYEESNIILKQNEITEKPIIQTNKLKIHRIHPVQTAYESKSKINIDIGKKFGF